MAPWLLPLLLACEVAVNEFPAAQAEASCQVLEACEPATFGPSWGNVETCTSLGAALAGDVLRTLPSTCLFDALQGRLCLSALDRARVTCDEADVAAVDEACAATFACGNDHAGLGGVIVPASAFKGD